jgi:hypothetical protein
MSSSAFLDKEAMKIGEQSFYQYSQSNLQAEVHRNWLAKMNPAQFSAITEWLPLYKDFIKNAWDGVIVAL